MKNTNNTQAKSFEVAYDNSILLPILDDGALWMKQKDLSQLFGVEGVKLFCEAEKIFKAKIFSRKENIAYFEVAGEKKLYFRIGFLISLGYRLQKPDAVKFIIKINRLIKQRCSKEKLVTHTLKEQNLDKRYVSLLGEMLQFGKILSTKSNTEKLN